MRLRVAAKTINVRELLAGAGQKPDNPEFMRRCDLKDTVKMQDKEQVSPGVTSDAAISYTLFRARQVFLMNKTHFLETS
jgi:hypothetical protein